jgi:hypothetical protein
MSMVERVSPGWETMPDRMASKVMKADMTSGTFGHRWKQTLCVFGPGLIEAARTLTPYWPVKRSRG